MDFSYTPEQQRLIARVRELCDFIKPYELECEMNNGLTPEAHANIRQAVLDADLQAVNMPREWGGAGLTTMEQILYHEGLGRLTNALWDTVWRPANALKACTPEQRERYLLPGIRGEKRDAIAVTEEFAGSDPLAMSTTAKRKGDRFIINGEKWFVTVGDVADFILTLAWVDDLPTLFIVDRDAPGLSVKRTPKYTHTFVYEHPEFTYDNVEVGPEQVLGEIGQGYDLIRDWFVEERLMIGARTVGAATRAIEESVDFATEPDPRWRRHWSSHQLIQAMLADMIVDTTGARTLVYQVGCEIDSGRARPQDAARQGSRREAGGVGGCRPRRRQRRSDPRRTRLHARLRRRAALPRAARGPRLGGHIRDPAAHHRQRDRQARRRWVVGFPPSRARRLTLSEVDCRRRYRQRARRR